ncbi:uncharacterized protein ATNIH1004_002313 [Aspergillus tanneri]|uniref:Uncharacterized protein n=1 Tax=Aspergillus tanneri TaxID=1220188 RepID=A0A5M9MR99_9EURO|nr:uncharacterized protein ATNIH1004_002313 [Aspergillus tanneri]KAA8649642.1 hypothetical protein ATNIH1004_002313 [Aspergillus tanneri]
MSPQPQIEKLQTTYTGVFQENLSSSSLGRNFVSLNRLSPQMWTYQSDTRENIVNLIRDINEGKNASQKEYLKEVRGKIIITKLPWDTQSNQYALPLVPDCGLADHISKRTFLIRNKHTPNQFWFNQSNAVVLSNDRRSRFRIELADTKNSIKNPVMLGLDSVKLSVVRGNGSIEPVRVKENGVLEIHGRGKDTFLFGLLHGGFHVDHVHSIVDGSQKTASAPIMIGNGDKLQDSGDVWELV